MCSVVALKDWGRVGRLDENNQAPSGLCRVDSASMYWAPAVCARDRKMNKMQPPFIHSFTHSFVHGMAMAVITEYFPCGRYCAPVLSFNPHTSPMRWL